MASTFARELWNARSDGVMLARDATVDPKTELEAYEIQAEIVSLSTLDVVGWKIGATVESLLEFLGVSQPFLGPLFQRFTYGNGAELPVLPGHGLETEFTIRMRSSLLFREEPYSRAEVADAVESVIPSFEIVGVRFEGGPAGAGLRIIADGGANVAAVLGREVHDWSDYDLTNYPVALSMNGIQILEGNPSDLMWDHIFDAVVWLLRHPIVSECGLRAGDIVMTGSFTGITPLSPGDRVEADFGKMGMVRANFV